MTANYVLLEKITVGAAGAASVTFSGIPQTGYTDLYLTFSPHTNRSSYANADMSLEINGSTSITSKAVYSAASGASSGGLQALMQGGNDALATNQSLVFGPTTIYFPNYTSSAFKSYSVDFTAEGNTSDLDQSRNGFSAGLWSSTAAINSIKISPNSGTNFVQHSTFYLYGVAKLGTTPVIVPYATGGDTIMTDGSYWYHAFVSSGTFTPAKGLSCDVLVVAGGGGGGLEYGGGGGAGGVAHQTSRSVSTATTVTIGAGGSAGTAAPTRGGTGSNSVFDTITANGGGGGGGWGGSVNVGASGGSGGGGSMGVSSNTTAAGGSATQGTSGGATGYGNAGGAGARGSGFVGGGGGGAGAVGVSRTITDTTGGAGGAGLNTWSTILSAVSLGVSGYIAGGGGGCGGSSTVGAGGAGGGGASANIGTAAIAGTVNTGSGGGGAYEGGATAAAAGGSGLTIVRYPV